MDLPFDFLLDFGSLGPSFEQTWSPQFLLLPPLLGKLLSIVGQLLDFVAICMSDLGTLQEDLLALTGAVRELTLAIRSRPAWPSEEERGASSAASEIGGSSHWELVEDGTGIPGAPANYLTTNLAIQFEEGPGPTPQFCIDLAKRHLHSSRHHPEERARAGFWAKAFWVCHSEGRPPYKPVAQAAHWILRKGAGFDLVRVCSQAESDRLSAEYPDIVFVEKLPTLTEVQIFCAGAKVSTPALWKCANK